MLQQLEPVAENLVADGEQAEEDHGGQDGPEEPTVGHGIISLSEADQGREVEPEVDGLQCGNGCEGGGGEQGVIESQGAEELDEQGKEILADPEVPDVGDDLVHDAEAPEDGPEDEDGQAEESAFVHGVSSVMM